MTPFPPEIASAMAGAPVDMVFRFAGSVPAAAAALLVAAVLTLAGLVRFDLPSHIPRPR